MSRPRGQRTELLRRVGRIVGGGVLRLIHASLTVGGTSTGAGTLAPAARSAAAFNDFDLGQIIRPFFWGELVAVHVR